MIKQYTQQLPKWIDGGRKVVVTVTKALKGIETLNGYDVEGTWIDSQDKTHRGMFRLKDLMEV